MRTDLQEEMEPAVGLLEKKLKGEERPSKDVTVPGMNEAGES